MTAAIQPQETLKTWNIAIKNNSRQAQDLLKGLNQKEGIRYLPTIIIKRINFYEADLAKYRHMKEKDVFKAKKKQECYYEFSIDRAINEYITTVAKLTSKKEALQPSKPAVDRLKTSSSKENLITTESSSSKKGSITTEHSKPNIETDPSESTSPNLLSNGSFSPFPNPDSNQELPLLPTTGYYTENDEANFGSRPRLFSDIPTLESPPSSPSLETTQETPIVRNIELPTIKASALNEEEDDEWIKL